MLFYAFMGSSTFFFRKNRTFAEQNHKLRISMTGVHILIAAVFIVFVIAFIITILVLNANAKKIISTNTKLVESQNMLFELNKQQGCESWP